jgi:hypothetical protein
MSLRASEAICRSGQPELRAWVRGCDDPNDPHRHQAAAFEAIAATLLLGSVGYEAQANARGERLIWLEAAVVDHRLTAMRGPER